MLNNKFLVALWWSISEQDTNGLRLDSSWGLRFFFFFPCNCNDTEKQLSLLRKLIADQKLYLVIIKARTLQEINS